MLHTGSCLFVFFVFIHTFSFKRDWILKEVNNDVLFFFLFFSMAKTAGNHNETYELRLRKTEILRHIQNHFSNIETNIVFCLKKLTWITVTKILLQNRIRISPCKRKMENKEQRFFHDIVEVKKKGCAI